MNDATAMPSDVHRSRPTFVMAIALGALCVASLTALHVARAATPVTGFAQPYAGTPKYQQYAPTEATIARQINGPIGAKVADRIARKLGLNQGHAFTPKQYALFISGKGVGGNRADAALVDASVRIFTNTTGRPLYATVDGTLSLPC